MPELPLDQAKYADFLSELARLVRTDPCLSDATALRASVIAHQESFGPRTAHATMSADDDTLRTLVHVMVLAASELADLHGTSRAWLNGHDRKLPPWDITVPRTSQRLITFGGRVYGVVEWEPQPTVELAPSLAGPDRKWATALAIAIGERPQWSDEQVARYGAYLTLGTESFGNERPRPDEELAERHGVPIEAVRLRRTLEDIP
jgi:hypothetical protein